MRVFVIVLLLTVGFSPKSDAQRIRYKNLFPILQSKDYKTAAPQLLQFLEENDDEANAYFYLGEIIVSQLDSAEIFPSTEKFDSMANRAIEAYKKSMALVDDREIRKNDDYYAAYNRRDLRTGKFAIKISDIHLDYENKIKEVVKKKELVNELHELKNRSIQEYESFALLVEDFHSRFTNESAYLLRAGPADIAASQKLVSNYLKFIEVYEDFTTKLKSLKHPSYDPQLQTIQIVNWNGLKLLKSNFSDFSVNIQNYEEYLNRLNAKIESEVKPLKDLLYKTDAEFNQAISQNLSISDSSKIQKMTIPENLVEQLKKYDEDNVILNLLKYKKQKSRTNLLTNVSLHPVLADSSNIYQRANLVEEYELNLTEQLDLIEKIDLGISDKTKNDFKYFLEGFKPSIEAFIETEKTIVKQKLDSVSQRTEMMARQIEFFRYEQDSIFLTPLIAATHEHKNYVLNTIELDSMLLVGGQMGNQPFIASAGFNMEVKSFTSLLDSSYTINNMIMLSNNLLVNLEGTEKSQQNRYLKYFSPNLEELWSLEYEQEASLGNAKVEAGIFFIYDQDGNVLQTLNSQGEIIGN
ncbi:hypothetical protein [uncultured Marivirga sp.]|mgnify:CR=1 FL=1|uniref:hypothetical protein n=1 Tax=uncultured Marivirga sp. TaxID=1123707 RepID=UPI0030EDB82B|tara:strand:- start:82056 stop:83795 length:1740 start_codon:yes stop_codon:yes gene_type:complete